jgi:cell division protease FtsH
LNNINNMIILILFTTLFSQFKNVNSFIPTKTKISVIRKVKDISSQLSSIKPSVDNLNSGLELGKNIKEFNNIEINPTKIINDFVGKPIGDYWSYETLVENVKEGNVDSVSMLTDKSGLLVIDHSHKLGEYTGNNIHLVKYFPDSFESILTFLNDNHVNFDLYKINPSSFSNPLIIFGQQTLSFVAMYFVFVFIINIIRGVLTGGQGGIGGGFGQNPMDQISKVGNLRNDIKNKNNNGNGLFNFGNGKNNDPDTTEVFTKFDDVAGCDEAKFELQEVVDFLKNPQKYEDAGAKIPTGVLLEGSPGTGKTLLARAVAGEADVPFISASGSEFIEMYVGVGASRVRNLFKKARENSPCVVFIDEIDAVGRQRGAGIAGGNDEREQTLNQILTNMDGFETADGIIVLAATNRVDILDRALIRPGRFDRKVNVGLPDYEGRKAIAKIHFRNKKLEDESSIAEVASLTAGFSGADLANLANEAAIFSVRKNETAISKSSVFDAYEKVTIGIRAFNQETDPRSVKLVTYHEVGHAIMVALFHDMFTLQKVTINANKSGAGGYTLFTPKETFMKFPTKKYMLTHLIIALGGRAAEIYLGEKIGVPNVRDQKVFKDFDNIEITTGASGDLKQAYAIANEYITTYGFSEEFNVVHADEPDMPFLGRDLYNLGGNGKDPEVENQINELIKFACKQAYDLIIENETGFLKVIELLGKERTIDGSEVEFILGITDKRD